MSFLIGGFKKFSAGIGCIRIVAAQPYIHSLQKSNAKNFFFCRAKIFGKSLYCFKAYLAEVMNILPKKRYFEFCFVLSKFLEYT